MSVAWEEYGNYATDVFTREAVKVIEVPAFHLVLPDIHFHLIPLVLVLVLVLVLELGPVFSGSQQ